MLVAFSAGVVVCTRFVASEAAAAGAVLMLPVLLTVLPLTAGVLLPSPATAAACTVSVASQAAPAVLPFYC